MAQGPTVFESHTYPPVLLEDFVPTGPSWKTYEPSPAEKRVEGLASLLLKLGEVSDYLPFNFGSSWKAPSIAQGDAAGNYRKDAYNTARKLLGVIDPKLKGK